MNDHDASWWDAAEWWDDDDPESVMFIYDCTPDDVWVVELEYNFKPYRRAVCGRIGVEVAIDSLLDADPYWGSPHAVVGPDGTRYRWNRVWEDPS